MNLFKTLAMVGLVLILLCSVSFGAREEANKISIVMSQNSCLIHGVEILEPATSGAPSFFSLQLAQKTLGSQEHIDRFPRVWNYAWQSIGIRLQKGTRQPEVDSLFKLQIFFENTSEKANGTSTGIFPGLVCVEGIEISSQTTLQSIRPQLEKAGFKITDGTARKGQIAIFFSDPSLQVNHIEQWVPSQ